MDETQKLPICLNILMAFAYLLIAIGVIFTFIVFVRLGDDDYFDLISFYTAIVSFFTAVFTICFHYIVKAACIYIEKNEVEEKKEEVVSE